MKVWRVAHPKLFQGQNLTLPSVVPEAQLFLFVSLFNFAMTSSVRKTWNDFTQKYRRELATETADHIMTKCATLDEASAFLSQVTKRIETQVGQKVPPFFLHPADVETCPTSTQSAALLSSLGKLRANSLKNPSQLHVSSVAIHDLDVSVVASGFEQKDLQKFGYDIGRVQFQNAKNKKQAKPPGRKSKVLDSEVVTYVGTVLQRYTNDSSKVVCVWRNKQKELVCAKLLSRRLWRIWKEEETLRSKMSWSTFRKIRRIHFPQIRPPQRKTDTCAHCRILKRKIAPRAGAEYKKRRRKILDHCPKYFEDLDSNPEFSTLVKADKVEEMVLQARRYINIQQSS